MNKRVLNKGVVLFLFFLLTSCSTSRLASVREKNIPQKPKLLAETKKFIWGINGHPVTNLDYVKTDLEQDLSLLKEHQFTFYRFELRTNQDGQLRIHSERFRELIENSTKYGIEILPVFLINEFLGNYQISQEEAYNRGYRQMKGFAESYGNYINYYALGNEQELRFLHAGSEGINTTDYEYEKFKIVAAYLKGMDKGLKEVNPQAKTIINSAGWKHLGYYELLKQEEVPYDILGYHWYSKNDTYLFDFGMGRITDLLYQKYQKPIWLTEINFTRGSYDSEEDQAEMMKKFIEDLYNQDHIEAFFIYELYDQPLLVNQEWAGAREAHFGIVKWKDIPPNYSEFEYKPVSTTIRFGIEQANYGYDNYVLALINDLIDFEPKQRIKDYWISRLKELKNNIQFIDEFYQENNIKNQSYKKLEDRVNTTYQELLKRSPTEEEKNFWFRKLKKDTSMNIRKTIVLSEEYWERAIWEGYERRTGLKRPSH